GKASVHYRLKHHKLQARRSLRRLEKRYRNHKHTVSVLAVLVIAIIGLSMLLALRDSDAIVLNKLDDTNLVILHADKDTWVLPTREKTVEGLLQNAGITINDGDVVEPALSTPIEEDDLRINVYRAAPVMIQDK